MTQAPEPGDARQAALQRLVASRQHLRAAWLPAPRRRPSPGERGPFTRRVALWWRQMRRDLGDNPVVALASQALGDWWQKSPWRAAGEALADEIHPHVVPLVRRHPVASVALAAGVGAAVAAARPWRWPLVARQMRVLPLLGRRWAFRLLREVPVQQLLAGLALVGGTAAVAAQADAANESQAELPPEAGPATADTP